MASTGQESYFCRRVPLSASCCLINASLRCFFNIIPRVIAISRHVSQVILFQTSHKKIPCHNFSALKTCFNAETCSQPVPTPRSGESASLLSVVSQPPPLLAVKFILPSSQLSVNLHPCWQSNSSLLPIVSQPPPLLAVRFIPPPNSQSTSTPAGSQIHPSSQQSVNLHPCRQ